MTEGLPTSTSRKGGEGADKPAESTRSRLGFRFLPLFFMAVSLIILSLLVDLGAAFGLMVRADPVLVVAAIGVLATTPFLVATKVELLLTSVGKSRGIARCARAVVASLTLNLMIPGRGGDLARAVFLMDEGDKLSEFAGLVIVERLIDLLALGLLVGLAALFFGPNAGFFLGLFAGLAGVSGLIILSLGGRAPVFQGLAKRLGSAARAMLVRPKLFVLTTLASMSGWLANCIQLLITLTAVGVAWQYSVAAIPAAVLTGVLPVSIAGIGTRDAALVALIEGPSGEMVAAGALLYTAVYLILPLFGSAVLYGQFAHVRAVLRARRESQAK